MTKQSLKYKPSIKKNIIPQALFDSLENVQDENNAARLNKLYNLQDFTISLKFLKAYKGSQGTFNAYRREIERLLQWCALISNKSWV